MSAPLFFLVAAFTGGLRAGLASDMAPHNTLPAAFAHQMQRAQQATRPAALRKGYRQWLVDGGSTWLYARAQARAVQYYPLPTLVLAPSVSNYTFSQNLLAYLHLSPAKNATSAVLYTRRGFVGYLDCQSKTLGHLSYCPCDTTKAYLTDVAQAWGRLQRAPPSFAFTVQGFRNCIFFIKDDTTYVTVLGNFTVYPLAYFLRAFCSESTLRKGYRQAGDEFLY